jgi:hypothetical protein
MNIKYILIAVILFTQKIFSDQSEKKASLCELFKPHPETALSAMANALFLLGQDYAKNTNIIPSSETINTIIWSSGAMYFSGLLAKIRKHYKQKKEEKKARLTELKRALINEGDGAHEHFQDHAQQERNTISIEISSEYKIEKQLENLSIEDKITVLLNHLRNNQEFATQSMILPDEPEEIYDFLLKWEKEYNKKTKAKKVKSPFLKKNYFED